MIVSRRALIDSQFSTSICAPVYSRHDGLSTQVRVGVEAGLKQECSIHCDELVSLPKSVLTNYVGSLRPGQMAQLNRALAIAAGIE